MHRRLALILTLLLLVGTAGAADYHRAGRFALGCEIGGSLSVGELLPIEFKPAPDAEWSIIVPVPLYPGNGLDIGALVDFHPGEHFGLRAWWGSQIPVQPQAAPPSYIDEITGSFHRFGLDALAYLEQGDVCFDVGLGLFCILASYEFLFDDFTTAEEDWETISGDTWTAGISPQLGIELFFSDSLALGGRLMAPISLLSDDDNAETDEEGYGNDGDGVELRIHLKYYF